MKKRLAKKIIKASAHIKSKTFKKTFMVFDAESKTWGRALKVWHVVYLPYSNEQIDTARRIFKSYAKQNSTYYKDHGAIILMPMCYQTVNTIVNGSIPTKSIDGSKYAIVESQHLGNNFCKFSIDKKIKPIK